MPLRYIRRKVTVNNVLNVAIATTSATQQLANLASFPPASIAAGVLLKIFQTIQDVQTNRSDCYRLANRCLSLLVDIQEQMEDRWADTPPSLTRALRKFEETLQSIHDFLKTEADNKWKTRLLRKGAIESALAEFNLALDDASRSFQIATLINIHYAVGDRRTASEPPIVVTSKSIDVTVVTHSTIDTAEIERSRERRTANITDTEELAQSPISKALLGKEDDGDTTGGISTDLDTLVYIPESPSTSSSLQENVATFDSIDDETIVLEDKGFRRYHQSDFVLKGRSRIKTGWWAGATEVQRQDQKSLMLRYDGPRDHSTKKWLRDVKILQNVYHPNLPQMVGYSNEETPTPFILLANVQTRLPQALVLDIVKNGSLAACVQLIVRFYRDTLDAALYLQRQLSLTDSKIQDYVEHADFRIDAEQTLIMGLPPPEVDRIQSWRNFGLTHSIRGIYLKLLPNNGIATVPFDSQEKTVSVTQQQKLSHLAILLNALLPSLDDTAAASARLQAVLDNEDEEEGIEESPQLTLREIRRAALKTKSHEQAWRQKVVPAYKHALGELGYIPEGKDDFSSFVVLCNVLEDNMFSTEIARESDGTQFSWETSFANRQELQWFPCPNAAHGWSIVLPPGTRQNVQIVHEAHMNPTSRAWEFLLDHGKDLAQKYGVKPESLMLVTRTGVDLRFSVHSTNSHHFGVSHRRPAFGHPQPSHGFGHMSPSFQMQSHMGVFGDRPPMPTILYLFTSIEKDQEPVWSDSPVYPLRQNGAYPPTRAECLISSEWTLGFLNYVQLHAEDFAT